MRRIFRALAPLFSLLLFVAPLFADDLTIFEGLKKKYLTLRNTDPDIKRMGEWEELASDFELYADTTGRSGEAASALFNASILRGELYGKTDRPLDLKGALSSLRTLYGRFPKSQLADDALAREGELLLGKEGDRRGAKIVFERLLSTYPSSELVEVARVRLAELEGKGAPASTRVPAISKPQAGGRIVVLDPGHGGEDLGAVGVSGLLEKDVVLDIASTLENILRETGRYQVFLTRRKDEFVPLERRTAYANEKEASVFLSLHCNSSPSGKLSGLEVYYLDNTGDKASQSLAERENGQQGGGGAGDLSLILSDLIQNAKLPDSIRFAEIISRYVSSHVSTRWGEAENLGVKKAPFYVLVGAHMPAALAELYFINHPDDGARLGEREFRADIAQALADGIDNYFTDPRTSGR